MQCGGVSARALSRSVERFVLGALTLLVRLGAFLLSQCSLPVTSASHGIYAESQAASRGS